MTIITRAIKTLILTLPVGSFALAEVVPVVSGDSPVQALSRYELTDIFLGKSRRFADGRPAVPVNLDEGAPGRESFYREFAQMDAAQLKAHWSKLIFTGRGRPPESVADADALKRRLANNPNAIGYLDSSQVDDSVRVVTVLE